MALQVKKEYGKLSESQFRELVHTLPELSKQRDDLTNLLAAMPKDKFNKLFVKDYNWGGIYELSFPEHLALAIVAFDDVEWLKRIEKEPDPQQAVLDSIQADKDQGCEPNPAFHNQGLIGIAYSLQRTILSVLLFQRSMSGLLQEVRENNDMDALFNAIRVDRTAMHCPTIADQIAKAQLLNDKRFFLRLRNALKGPTQKHWVSYCDLRFSLFVLRELGFNKLSDDQLEDLLVHKLKVFPNTPAARKNLRAHYQQSRKIKTF